MTIEPAERFHAESLDAAAEAFRRDGVVVIDQVIDPALLEQCRDALGQLYPEYFTAGDGENRYCVSEGRFHASVTIEGLFAHGALIANPVLMPFAQKVLGKKFVLDSFGVINALPGAVEQGWHCDGGLLFPESPIDRMLPAPAVTFILPLVEMNDRTGSTGFSLGSHRKEFAADAPDCVPTIPVGSCALWDYRVFHKGMANRADHARPLIYGVYCRPWWIDTGNFDGGRGEKMVTTRAALEQFDGRTRELLLRADII